MYLSFLSSLTQHSVEKCQLSHDHVHSRKHFKPSSLTVLYGRLQNVPVVVSDVCLLSASPAREESGNLQV